MNYALPLLFGVVVEVPLALRSLEDSLELDFETRDLFIATGFLYEFCFFLFLIMMITMMAIAEATSSANGTAIGATDCFVTTGVWSTDIP